MANQPEQSAEIRFPRVRNAGVKHVPAYWRPCPSGKEHCWQGPVHGGWHVCSRCHAAMPSGVHSERRTDRQHGPLVALLLPDLWGRPRAGV